MTKEFTFTTRANARQSHLIDVVVEGHHKDMAMAAHFRGFDTFCGFGRTGFSVHPDNLEGGLADLRRCGYDLRRAASHHLG